MFNKLEEGIAEIKAFVENDWQWIRLEYDTRNLKNRDLENYKELNPSLVRKGTKFFLHVPYTNDVTLKSKLTTIDTELVVGVDLGLTNTAVCSVMTSGGTVLERLFINQSREKDLLKSKLNKLAKAQRISRGTSKPDHWRRINGLQNFIVQDTANQIVELAKNHGCTHIIFENLDSMKLPR